MGKKHDYDCQGGVDCVDEEHLCKVSKQNDLDKLKELVSDAQFICRKCGRSAHSAKNLCKPEDL